MIRREKITYNNGLEHIHYYVPYLKTVTASFFIKTGSTSETDESLFGISHFLEHMTFNGSGKYPDRNKTDKFITGLGVYQDAWTWFAQTNYLINSTPDSLEESFDILIHRVFNPLLRVEDIRKEKGIVQEERGWGENDPELDLYYKINNLLYEGTTAQHQVIGTKRSIANFDKRLLTNYHNTYYAPKNSVFISYGGIPLSDLSDKIGEKLEGLQNRQEDSFCTTLSDKIEKWEEVVEVNYKRDTSASFIQDLMVFEKPSTLAEYVCWIYVKAILGEGSSSILEKKLMLEDSLVSGYGSELFVNGLYMNVLFSASTNKSKRLRVRRTYDEVFDSIGDYVTDSNVARAKGYLYGRLLIAIEDPFFVTESDFLNIEYLNQLLDFEVGFEDLSQEIRTKQTSDIRDFVSKISPIRRGVGVIN